MKDYLIKLKPFLPIKSIHIISSYGRPNQILGVRVKWQGKHAGVCIKKMWFFKNLFLCFRKSSDLWFYKPAYSSTLLVGVECWYAIICIMCDTSHLHHVFQTTFKTVSKAPTAGVCCCSWITFFMNHSM